MPSVPLSLRRGLPRAVACTTGAAIVLVAMVPPGASAQGPTPPSIEQLQSVTSPRGGEPPAWSADGARLVYVGSDGGLWSVGVNGGAPMRHAASLGGASQMRRSPDGRLFAYVKNVPGGNDIFAWDLAAGTERRLTRLSGHVRSYAFSPAGDRIALANDRSGSEDVYSVDVATGVATRLTSSPLYETFPSFTADGKHVVYTRLDSRWVDHDVFSVPVEGGAARAVLSDKDYFDYRQGASFGFARVSPDGQSVLFRSITNGTFSREHRENALFDRRLRRAAGRGIRGR